MLRKLVSFLVCVFLLLGVAAKADNWRSDYHFDDYDGEFEDEYNDGIVIARNINVRPAPSKKERTICSLKSEDTMKILDGNDKWFQIELEDGTQGWVRKMFIATNYSYITFDSPTNIYCLPSHNAKVLVNPQSVVGKQFLVVGEFGSFIKVKLGYGIGFVDVGLCEYQEIKGYKLLPEYEYYKLIPYGMSELYTDRYISDIYSNSSVGEISRDIFTCIGDWGHNWIVQYGQGVAFIRRDSPILSELDIDYYYEFASQNGDFYVWTWTATDVKGPQGNGKFGTLDEGEWVRVLDVEDNFYVIMYEFNGIRSVGWILREDTLTVEEYKEMRIEEAQEEKVE